MIKILYVELFKATFTQNTYQRKNVKLPYIPCYFLKKFAKFGVPSSEKSEIWSTLVRKVRNLDLNLLRRECIVW